MEWEPGNGSKPNAADCKRHMKEITNKYYSKSRYKGGGERYDGKLNTNGNQKPNVHLGLDANGR